MYICEHCGQTSITELVHQWDGKPVCQCCNDKLKAEAEAPLNDWENPHLAISMEVGCSFTDFDTIIIPFRENCDDQNIDTDLPVLEAFQLLKEKWESEKWGYDGSCREMQLVIAEVQNPAETVKCDEFSIWIYSESAYKPEFYSRPFDLNPEDLNFACYFAADCYKGEIYSKDFAYFDCDVCERTICGQNPSNGWMSQMHFHDNGWLECNKCYEERVLREGINDEFNNDIPGQFFNESEILESGWEKQHDHMLAGSGYTGYADPQSCIGLIRSYIDQDLLVLVNYESMAIGGLGGYVSIFTKPKKAA